MQPSPFQHLIPSFHTSIPPFSFSSFLFPPEMSWYYIATTPEALVVKISDLCGGGKNFWLSLTFIIWHLQNRLWSHQHVRTCRPSTRVQWDSCLSCQILWFYHELHDICGSESSNRRRSCWKGFASWREKTKKGREEITCGPPSCRSR